VLSGFKERVARKIKSINEGKPLVSSKKDLELLKKIKGKRVPGLKQFGHIRKILSPLEKRIITMCVIVMCFGVVLFGFSIFKGKSMKVPTVGGRYTEAVVGSPQLVNPIFATINDVDVDITRLVFSGLMKYDKNQKLVPDLAESYEISEDKRTYIFKLRKDVMWHNDQPFTVRDVLFTFQTIQEKIVGSPLYVSFQGVEMEVLDDYTISFILKEPFAPFLSSMTVGIISEDIWFDVQPDRMRLHKKNLEPIGTGPFKFKKLVKDDSGYIHTYELERFENYYGETPYIEEFVFKFFAEYEGVDGAIQALRGQRVEGLSFVPQDLKEKVERKHIDLHTLQLPQYTALFFNQEENEALKEGKLRKALEESIDKDRILREALKDEGQVIYSSILPGFPGYNPEIEKTEYNVEEANILLDELWPKITAEEYLEERKKLLIEDWERSQTVSSTTSTIDIVNEDGTKTTSTLREFAEKEIEERLKLETNAAQIFYRKNKDGVLLELDLVTANTQEYRKASEYIAGFWQEIGIKTNVEFVDTKEFSRNVLKGRDYDVLLYGMILGSDPDQFPFWHSSQVDFPGLNLSKYVNRNIDALLEKLREIDDEEEEIELYKKFQDILIKERPAVFLYMPTYTYATTDEVEGIDIVRIFHPSDRFANVYEWYMDTKIEWNK
jgi:peptide/nickel transport system substrate-binding protein